MIWDKMFGKLAIRKSVLFCSNQKEEGKSLLITIVKSINLSLSKQDLFGKLYENVLKDIKGDINKRGNGFIENTKRCLSSTA